MVAAGAQRGIGCVEALTFIRSSVADRAGPGPERGPGTPSARCAVADSTGQPRPGCGCSSAEVAGGHRHRCPMGPPTYVAIGRWASKTTEQITREWPVESADPDLDEQA